MSNPPWRERRWLVLVEDGRHTWQGRRRDPDPEDLALLEKSMRQHGLRGWLTVSEGWYHLDGPMTLMMVHPLNSPRISWEDAEAAFHRLRAAANAS